MIRILLALCIGLAVATPAAAQALTGTLKKVKDSGTITFGYRESSPPFSMKTGDGKPTGYSVELCTRVAAGIQQQLGLADLKVQWVPVTVESRLRAVATGAIDLECGSTTNTLSRQEQVDFSLLTFVDGGSLLVRDEARISVVGDLNGKRVGIIPGTTTEKSLAEAVKKAVVNPRMVTVRDHAEGVAALEEGRIDAYASDRVILVGLGRSAKDPSKLSLSEAYFSYEPYGLVLRRNDPDFRLAVNRVLARLYRTEEIVQIYARWFGSMGRPGVLLQAMFAINALPE